ncbi:MULTISPECIES: DUF3854 domain-containing protein [unclassified Microcoleus]|uniref:DUF3854 domain-containing protein n=1 Tax=unclassified Microcoleus TaxID=2642155 RepID=UPI002FCE8C89
MDSVSSISQTVVATRNKSLLNAADKDYLRTERKLPLDWIYANCGSADIPKASVLLGYDAKSPCIVFYSHDLKQLQLRPIDPWPSKDGKLPKYRTPRGEYDAFLAKHPEIETYWTDLEALKARCFTLNGKPYLLITEGCIKAIKGCMWDIPTVAVMGVDMALTPKAKGEPDLIPGLKRLAEAGFNFIISYDSDPPEKVETIKNVRRAEKTLTKALKAYGCEVLSVTGSWRSEDGKGMDDFINSQGIETFRAVLMKASNVVESPDTSDTSSTTRSKKTPTPREIAAQLAEEYRPHWKYHEEQQTWRGWTGKCWEKIKPGPFKSLIVTTLDAKGINYSGIEYVNNVIEMLKCYLREVYWQTWDKSRYVNFENCVLDGDTLTTQPHSPGMGFTSYLPFPYRPLTGDLSAPLEVLKANCPNIHQFFQTAMQGDTKKIFKLLAMVNSCLRFSFYGYQQFVHFIGVPGSGKGTCARLMEKVVGKGNTQPCSLDSLKDGSTLASIIDKQLVVFGDERKPVGVDSILRLTGGDSVNYREVYQPAANSHFYGLLLICSNDPIFMGNTTGLERRLCLVNFENAIPKALRNSEMEASFDPEIGALIAIALSLPSGEVKQAIQGIGDAEIADFKAAEWDMKVRMDSLAAFFEMELIVEDDAQTRAGDLFDSYKYFCEEIKKPAMSLTTFSPGLEKLCTELHLPVVRDRSGRHVTFVGLRLRGKNDYHPTYSQQLAPLCRTSNSTSSTSAGLSAGLCSTSAGLSAGLPPIQDIGLQDLQDLSPNILAESEITEKTEGEPENQNQENQKKVEVKEVTQSSPASPANPLQDKGLSPVTSPAEVLQSPALSPATAQAKFRGEKLADRMRGAIAKGSWEDAKEVSSHVAASSLQIRGFYKKSLSEKEIAAIRVLKDIAAATTKQPRFVIGDSVEISSEGEYQGKNGEITDIGFGATETDYYIQLEGEKVIVSIPVGASDLVTLAYLRKL